MNGQRLIIFMSLMNNLVNYDDETD